MFEDQQQAVDELLSSNETFRTLHEQHSDLKKRIAEIRSAGTNDFHVERMKKEKLFLKDKMAVILADHKSA
ncbi:MAG: YdcH family protein [Magnetococcales bacterium]|nr:YdcH family protein [Magnetococcales bacterium]